MVMQKKMSSESKQEYCCLHSCKVANVQRWPELLDQNAPKKWPKLVQNGQNSLIDPMWTKLAYEMNQINQN